MNLTLSLVDFAALSPLLILLVGAMGLLLFDAFAEKASKQYSFSLAIAILVIATAAALWAPVSKNALLTDWLRFDAFSQFFTLLFLSVGLSAVLLSYSFFQNFDPHRGEYFFLLFSALFGLILIAAAADFLTLFLGLETLSISLYVLCGYMKKWGISNEASIKYFLMGSIAAAFLLYGIALIYGAVGTTRFEGLLAAYRGLQSTPDQTLFLTGIALVTLGLAFKAAIVPFHLWAPDVYDGAPTPITAFMAVGTKAGAFAAFARLFLIVLPQFDAVWNQGIALLVYPTLIYANIVAMQQVQLRRFFAYSGISHAGFMLIPLAAGTPDALQALEFYLVVYALATLGSFAVLAFLDKRTEGVMFNDLYGLFKRAPLLAVCLTICLLTLAGIPPTAGFFAKFYLFKVAFQGRYYGLVIVGLLTAVLSAYYYLRIVALMFSEEPSEAEAPSHVWPAAVVGAISLGLIILLSCYPSPLLTLLATAD